MPGGSALDKIFYSCLPGDPFVVLADTLLQLRLERTWVVGCVLGPHQAFKRGTELVAGHLAPVIILRVVESALGLHSPGLLVERLLHLPVRT